MLLNLGTQEAIVGKYSPELKIMFKVQLQALLFTNFVSKPHLSSHPGNYLSLKALKFKVFMSISFLVLVFEINRVKNIRIKCL